MVCSRRVVLCIALALAALVSVAYLGPLALGKTFALRDNLSYTIPLRVELARALDAGRVPEWWDGIALGVPFASNPTAGVVYPPTWLVALVPMPFGADLLLMLHVWWMALGVALLARRLGASTLGSLFAGVALALCGYVTSIVIDGIPVLSMAWIPWVALATHRLASARARGWIADCALLSALFGMQLLSGGPTGVVDAGLLALVIACVCAPARRLRSLARVAAGLAGGVGLGAALWLPALSVLHASSRQGGLPLSAAGAWSMHPWSLLAWVWPRLLGDPTDSTRNLARLVADTASSSTLEPAWAMSVYIGLPTVICAGAAAAAGRRLFALTLAALGFAVLALGVYTPLYALYRTLFLPERILRYPEKHLAGALVLGTALAGVGFSRAFAGSAGRRLVWMAATATALLGLGVGALALGRRALVARLGTAAHALTSPLSLDEALHAALSGGAEALAVAALFVLLLALARHRRFGRVAAPAALALVAGQLLMATWGLEVLVDRSAIAAPPALLAPVLKDAVRKGAPRPRLYRPQTIYPESAARSSAAVTLAMVATGMPNVPAEFGFANFPGYEPTISARFFALWQHAVSSGNGARLLRLFDVRYVILPAAELASAGFVPRAEAGGLVLGEVPNRRPRAFVATRWRWVAPRGSDRALFAPDRRKGEIVLEGAGSSRPGEAPLSACAVRAPRPERVELACQAPQAGFAVLLDAAAPGWSATVDGRPAPIVRADGMVRAVAIGPGAHRIVFSYRTPHLRLGALVSLASAWLLLLLGARYRRARDQPQRERD